jgi:hypothetical protein
MIPDPIPLTKRNQGPPPRIELTLQQAIAYARRAEWLEKTIQIIERNPPGDWFLCGGREVRILGVR